MTEAVEFHIGGLRFDGFDQGFADRAGAAFEAGLRDGLDAQGLTERLAAGAGRELGLLTLGGLDFSTPERLGRSLARAVLREVAG